MRRFDRLAVALAAVLALLAGSTLPCLCAPTPADTGHADAHACCTRGPGLRAADETCCAGQHDREPEPWTPSAALAAASPASHAVAAAVALMPPPIAPVAPPRPVSAYPPLRI